MSSDNTISRSSSREAVSKRGSSIPLLLSMLDEAYEKSAWHGPNLRGSLRGVAAEAAAWRPARGRHNIWELVLHAAYWKYAVRRRLTGEKRASFGIAGSNWFERPVSRTEKAWREDLALLDRAHRALRSVVAEFAEEDLASHSIGSKHTNARLIYGIASHDLYHTGQIQLVKALMRELGGRAKGMR